MGICSSIDYNLITDNTIIISKPTELFKIIGNYIYVDSENRWFKNDIFFNIKNIRTFYLNKCRTEFSIEFDDGNVRKIYRKNVKFSKSFLEKFAIFIYNDKNLTLHPTINRNNNNNSNLTILDFE